MSCCGHNNLFWCSLQSKLLLWCQGCTQHPSHFLISVLIILLGISGASCTWYKHSWLFLQDDILPKLMTSTGSYDDLFRKEISKYDQICQEISKNIEAQENLLVQIQVCLLPFIICFPSRVGLAHKNVCFLYVGSLAFRLSCHCF